MWLGYGQTYPADSVDHACRNAGRQRRRTCPEQLVAAVVLGHELVGLDQQASLDDSSAVGACVCVVPPYRGWADEPVLFGAASCWSLRSSSCARFRLPWPGAV